MEEEILDIKRENYKLRKENYELIQDNAKFQKEIELLNYRIKETLLKEVNSYHRELEEKSVLKSKIQEKIEELKELEKTMLSKLHFNQRSHIISKIIVLQELLEDKQKECN